MAFKNDRLNSRKIKWVNIMYNIPYHKEKDKQVIDEFIKQYPLAFLTGCDAENKPVVTQIPLFIEEVDGQKLLRGHIMKNNDHHKAFLNNENVLAVFTGKNTYVSGTWYSNPYTPSTWNYMSVHIKGNLKFINESELEDILRVTSLYFENQNTESTTIYDKLPTAFKQKALGMIAGFEIEIVNIDTVFKLSQDRDVESYQNIIRKLEGQNEDGRMIAEEMLKREKGLFSKKNE
jgi:transcriptional regulator